MAGIAKDAIEIRDAALFENVDGGWRQILYFWLERHAAGYVPESLDKELAVSIRNTRERMRYTVACWLVRRLLAEPQNPQLLSMFERVRLRYPNVGQLARIAAVAAVIEHSDQLSDWVMSDQPGDGQMHSVDSLTPLVEGTALLVLASDPQTGQQLRPHPWLLMNKQRLIGAAEALGSREEIRKLLLLTVADVEAAVQATKVAFERAADAQAELNDESLIAATVSDEVRERFQSAVGESWNTGRSMFGLLLTAGADHIKGEDTAPAERLQLNPSLELKMWAVGESADRIEQVGAHFGEALADSENERFGRLLVASRSGEAAQETTEAHHGMVTGDISDRVQSMVDQMLEDGYRPSLILHGPQWGLPVNLNAEPIEPGFDVDARVQGLRGRWRGLLIAETWLLDDSVIVVIDAAAWVAVRAWPENSGGTLIATLTTYTAESAEEYINDYPDILDSAQSAPEKVRELQRRMLVNVSVSWEARVKDLRAARIVPLTNESS
jgi:hypothetical protein